MTGKKSYFSNCNLSGNLLRTESAFAAPPRGQRESYLWGCDESAVCFLGWVGVIDDARDIILAGMDRARFVRAHPEACSFDHVLGACAQRRLTFYRLSINSRKGG